jgi:hypothetical protein
MVNVRGKEKDFPTNRRKAERVGAIMAEKKMTRKEALEIAIAAVENTEAIEVLEKIYAQVT